MSLHAASPALDSGDGGYSMFAARPYKGHRTSCRCDIINLPLLCSLREILRFGRMKAEAWLRIVRACDAPALNRHFKGAADGHFPEPDIFS
jgi:hypothetical protein